MAWSRVSLACVLWVASVSCARAPVVRFDTSGQALTVHGPALYPETVEYNVQDKKFLIGSFRNGAIYEVDSGGNTSLLVDDPRLCSVLGIAVDAGRNRLWAVSSDLGASVKPSAAGPKKLAVVALYELSTGRSLNYFDLAPLAVGPHLLNGIAVDALGNAYVTDSFSPVIYKIDTRGVPSVFLRDDRFLGEGVNLNGVVVHPDGYLLVVKKSDGALFKVPLQQPARFTKVSVPEQFVGGDGVTLVNKSELVLVANQTPERASNAAFSVSSEDGWVSARLVAVQPLGDVYPTTAVLRDGLLYVLHSRLNELLQRPPAEKNQLTTEATIRPIAVVSQ